jgi:hypothetical protein
MSIFDFKKFLSNRTRLVAYGILMLCSYCVYQISFWSPIYAYAKMDPRGSSLVAQSIIEHGTIRVDGYRLPAAPWLFEVKNRHTYSTYPLGTPIFILPFVANALRHGHDMQSDKTDFRLQKRLAGCTLIAFLFLAYFILRSFVEPVTSALAAAGWTLGSGIMSTMGAALWSINLAVIFESVVVLILVRYFTGQSRQLRPFLIGLLVFAGYLCRPSAALLAVPSTILILRESKLAAAKLVATFWLLMLGLCFFSLREFGTWLPEYYSLYAPNAVGISLQHWRKALYGLIFGPARGLFVYQPFLVVILLVIVCSVKTLWRKPLFWFAVSWVVLDIILVSRWPMWWGGGSFGSRLLVESFPGWVILTGLAFAEGSVLREHAVSYTLSFGILVGLGIFIHSYQGLYNWSTWQWNGAPRSLGNDPTNYYDWRYPQFLATPEMIQEMKTQHSKLSVRMRLKGGRRK